MKKYALPEIPNRKMLNLLASNDFAENWKAGKEMQQKYGGDKIPYTFKYELAAGQYARLLQLAEEIK